MPRIGIDCRLSGSAHAGIGRYVANLVSLLPERAPSATWVLFFFEQTQVEEIWPNGNIPANVEIKFAPIKHYSFAEQWQWPLQLASAQLDVLHVPHFNIPLLYRGPLLVTIHDLLWHEYRGQHVTTLPATWYWLKYWVYRWVTSVAVQRAKVILVPAETIKKTVEKYYPGTSSKIVVTKEGIAPAFSAALNKHLPAQAQPAKQLVYVGSLYPHKNVQLVLRALAQLPDYKLKIVGVRTVFQQPLRVLAQELGVDHQVEWLGYQTDQELIALLHRSWCLVQPSHSEGFGLTGVEGMAAGTPVLASDIPIFREIYQQAALFFDPNSVEELVAAVHQLDQPRRKQQVTRGYTLAATYRWPKMVELTLAAFAKIGMKL